MTKKIPLSELLEEVRSCQVCAEYLPFDPKPVVRASETASILIIGQAPGTRVQTSGVPWDDPSGRRLRDWMGITETLFYDESKIAIIPMGFCYPGKGKSGDLPPRPECAKLWHDKLLTSLPNIRTTLLIGQYAQRYYIKQQYKTLTETVSAWRDFQPRYFPLPHPSPRNNIWLHKNPWFENVVIALKDQVSSALNQSK